MNVSDMRQHAWRQVGTWGKSVLDALLPPQCLTCDAPVIEAGRFCVSCFNATQFISTPCCQSCGTPFAFALAGGIDNLCPQCRAEPPPWGRARAAFAYDAHSRRAILPLKYHDRPELAVALGRMMARAGSAVLADADLLVPVPLHRARLRLRRYNQAALLARAVTRFSEVPACLDALVRTRATRSLGEMSAGQRAATVSGVFAVRPARRGAVAGRSVVLIDDVLTSGATAGACTHALLAGGAARVDVLVAARVPDPHAS